MWWRADQYSNVQDVTEIADLMSTLGRLGSIADVNHCVLREYEVPLGSSDLAQIAALYFGQQVSLVGVSCVLSVFERLPQRLARSQSSKFCILHTGHLPRLACPSYPPHRNLVPCSWRYDPTSSYS